MNKLISVKQIKKNVELYDDWDDYFEDEELHSEFIYDENLNNMENIKNINQKIENTCQNEKCDSIVSEINILKEECVNLEKKCILIDYVKSEQLIEVSDRISEMCNSINKLINEIEIFEGDDLDKLNYEELSSLEFKLLKLYKKIRLRISKIELEMLNGKFKLRENISNCRICMENDLNCIIKPCNHICICFKCAENSLKCLVCHKFIEYIDKIFIPNN